MKKNELIKDIMQDICELTAHDVKLKYGPITEIISNEMGRKSKKKNPQMKKKSIVIEITADLGKMKAANIDNIRDDILDVVHGEDILPVKTRNTDRPSILSEVCANLERRVSKLELNARFE